MLRERGEDIIIINKVNTMECVEGEGRGVEDIIIIINKVNTMCVEGEGRGHYYYY